MSTTVQSHSDTGKFISCGDLADDLFGYVREFYCGDVKKCKNGFVLCDINGKKYEVRVNEIA